MASYETKTVKGVTYIREVFKDYSSGWGDESEGGRTVRYGSWRKEQTGNSKLTADAVRDIRKKHNNWKGTHSIAMLAREYNVSASTVSNIVNDKTWKHVRP
jgi:DNA invertase Pin-like site-specific DNA recombinase